MIVDHQALEAVIKEAYDQSQALEIFTGHTKQKLGNAMAHNHLQPLDLSNFQGIIDYMPSELTLRAGAATKMQDIEAALAKNDQMLAFEPPDFSKILGSEHPENASLIGNLMTNLSGSRRPLAGAARDHFLAFKAISGRGEPFKYGAAVVKNVTGYDLCKIMAGSYGTLSAIYEVIVKVLPKASQSKSLIIKLRDAQNISPLLLEGFSTPFSVSGVTMLPAMQETTANWRLNGDIEILKQGLEMPIIAMRLEGLNVAVDARLEDLRAHLMRKFEDLTPDDFLILDEDSVPFWQHITNLTPFMHHDKAAQIWRISLPPASALDFINQVRDEQIEIADYYMDWGGALCWICLKHGLDLDANILRAEKLRKIANHYKAIAMLFRGDTALKCEIGAFHPMPKPLADLNHRLKQAFDPNNIFNPNRM